MKRTNFTSALCLFLALAAGGWICGENAFSQTDGAEGEPAFGQETEMDLPGSFHHYYGQRVNQWRDTERYVAKLDLDADLNYDGVVSNDDPADGGAFEHTPPGLIVGVGELSKLIIRVRPYRLDYRGEVVVTMEVAGINRASRSGEFESFDQELASTGQIRVWSDAQRSKLLLDSADPELRTHEWVADMQVYPANLPGVFPRLVYVEGMAPSALYSGDVRLLVTVSQREKGVTRETYAEYRARAVKAFRTSFDHLLLTVKDQPQEKLYINNNAEGVWITPGTSGPPK